MNSHGVLDKRAGNSVLKNGQDMFVICLVGGSVRERELYSKPRAEFFPIWTNPDQ